MFAESLKFAALRLPRWSVQEITLAATEQEDLSLEV
jgi:hypothetical protein